MNHKPIAGGCYRGAVRFRAVGEIQWRNSRPAVKFATAPKPSNTSNGVTTAPIPLPKLMS